MSTISASTTSTTAFKITTDTTGTLVFQTGSSPTTAVTFDGSQNLGVGITNPAGYGVIVGYKASGTASYIVGLNGGGCQTAIGVAGDNESYLGTLTNHVLRFATNGVERARIDTSGNLLVGTTSSDIAGGGTTTRISANNGTGYAATNVNTGTAAYSVYQLGNNNTANRAGVALFGASYTSAGLYRQDGVYLYSGGAGGVTLAAEQAQPIYFATNNTERARFNAGAAILCLSGGNTSATGTGIAFPGTYNASSDVNTLDDYEEGDWTPRISGSGGGNYTPGSINAGRYIKIGKMVWATATLQWTAVVSAYSGNLLVSGLPFTSTGQRAAGSMGAILNGLSFTAGYGEWNYLIDPGVAYVYIIQNSTTGAGYSHNPTVGSSGTVYALSVVYEAA